MASFDELFKEYANTKNGDVFAFCQKYKGGAVATRFLLIRSIDSDSLKDLLSQHKISYSTNKEKELMNVAYNSAITINDLLVFIENKRPELIKKREQEVEGLDEVLDKIPVVGCGVRNDTLDTIVQAFTRNKEIKTYEDLEKVFDEDILSRLKQYCLWSYYNQTSNDIIELIFLKHKNVIPTLRKIYNIDFFLRVGDEIVPFDLKITHVSDVYFELASKGIQISEDTHDDFVVNMDNPSELQKLKTYYKEYKKNHKNMSLPPIKEFKNDIKATLAELIRSFDKESDKFISDLVKAHEAYVPSDDESLKMLEWWNYKDQGQRLFCNNNRLFVFLAYKNQFIDGKNLKGNTKELEKKINALLDSISPSVIHTINYHYEKDEKLVGDYTAYALSTIYSE